MKMPSLSGGGKNEKLSCGYCYFLQCLLMLMCPFVDKSPVKESEDIIV